MDKFADRKVLEKYSSAITLSDMEIYIFPELLYALVLANIMSPRIWAWRSDPWFRDLESMSFSRKAQRLKQFIMDHFSFNLDLDTWGLTTKPRELARFSEFVTPDFFSRSNALFGYEGDKYYYDIDIRRHFGLDQYHGDVIPYWKTETVEAMEAFRHKPGYHQGAGECVSLAALYAAAFYVILQVPLENIFLMATPLHSQNFVLGEGGGLLTNNRRLVTKTMWFNGTELTAKARRALENERVTLVAHVSGHIHIDYPEATIAPTAYRRFTQALEHFLTTSTNFEIFANFLRVHEEYRRYFQIEYDTEGHRYYLPVEVLYKYEHGSKHRIGDKSRGKLLEEVEREEYQLQPDPNRYVLNALEMKLNGRPLVCRSGDLAPQLGELLPGFPELEDLCRKFCRFTCVHPRLPEPDKQYQAGPGLQLAPGMAREEIIRLLEAARATSPVADLAFYAGRIIPEEGWMPFLSACLGRNPVSLEFFREMPAADVYNRLKTWEAESIYDGPGLATPDEVVNYRRGDGLEKALCFLNVLRDRKTKGSMEMTAQGREIRLSVGGQHYGFESTKNRQLSLKIDENGNWKVP